MPGVGEEGRVGQAVVFVVEGMALARVAWEGTRRGEAGVVDVGETDA